MKENELIYPNKTAIIDLESPSKNDNRHPYLVIYIGNDHGLRHKLSRGVMTIGRSPHSDITIEDDRISRTHCIIEWVDDTIAIKDKGSTNGTYVNARRVNRALLMPGVSVQLGHSLMKIEYKSEAEIRSEESLLYRASFDALTGIFNRRHFIRLASMEISYASRHKLPMGVIMMDIDNYKVVNDTYGHQLGDCVLIQFAKIINENTRTYDLFARYGSDEFIKLPRGGINKEVIRAHCERIRKAVESYEFRTGEACFRISVSIGFHLETVIGNDIETILSDLIFKADQALVLAKKRGKNRTESLL